MAVSIQQACANALGTYLTTELGALARVSLHWPGPDRRLPTPSEAPSAVTVVLAGPRKEVRFQKYATDVTVLSPTQVSAAWVVGSMEQMLQMDVWASYDADMDATVAALQTALLRGPGYTLPGTNGDPVAESLLLPLGDGWTGQADFAFDEVQRHDSPANKKGEYRATYRGMARAAISVVATSPRMATIIFRQRLRETDAIDATKPYDITTITASGHSHSTGP